MELRCKVETELVIRQLLRSVGMCCDNIEWVCFALSVALNVLRAPDGTSKAVTSGET